MEVASNAIQNLRQQSELKSKTSPNSSFSTFDNTDQHNDKQHKLQYRNNGQVRKMNFEDINI